MTAAAGAWRVTVSGDWKEAAMLWRPMLDSQQATPFQGKAWLQRWYGALAKADAVEPVLVHVAAADGTPAIALPLVRLDGRLRVLEFADLGITDYNAPLIGPAAPADTNAARSLWVAVRAALPPADLFRADKLPETVLGRPNPLVLALGGRPSSLFGNLVRIESGWEDWLKGLEKHNRKELGRFWRVFTRDPRARFEIADTPERALEIYRRLEIQQSARMHELGQSYRLDEPVFSDFYRDLLLAGLSDGSAVLSALTAGEELVAALFGIARGDHFAMVRISTGGGEWAHCSPGRLVIGRTMEALHERGFRAFDFTIGDYGYKNSFEVARVPLMSVEDRLSWRAWPSVGYSSAKDYVKRHPTLARLARRALRKAA